MKKLTTILIIIGILFYLIIIVLGGTITMVITRSNISPVWFNYTALGFMVYLIVTVIVGCTAYRKSIKEIINE